MSYARAIAEGRARLAEQRELRGPDGTAVLRVDAWANQVTGIGTQQDKTMHGYFEPVWRIDDAQLTNLYNGSALVAKMVEKPAREMFRRGYKLKCDDFEESELEELRMYALDTFSVDDEFRKGKTFGDLYGGMVSILLADDGNLPSEPLDENRIKTFRGINSVDRRFAYVLDYYNDPLEQSKFGRPKHYLISNAVAGFSYTPSGINPTAIQNPIGRRSPEDLRRRGFGTVILHESRLIRWGGVETDQVTMQTLAGWGWSRIQRIYDTLRDFEHAFRCAGYLLSDASQGVLKLKKLFDVISAGNKGKVDQRVRFLDEMRSVMRMIVLDTDQEDFKREPTPFTGIPEMLDKYMLRLAADMDMPETELFGRAPQGLNATGENERKKWFDLLGGYQTSEIAPPLKRFYHLLSLAADSPVKRKKSKGANPARWTIDFKPLSQPTDKEQAETDEAIARRDQIMMAEGAVQPEVVALTHQDWYPSLDVDALEKAINAQTSFDPYENDQPETQQVGGETPSPNVGLPVPGTPGDTTPGLQAPLAEKSGLANRPGQPLSKGVRPEPGAKPKPQSAPKRPKSPPKR